MDKEFKIKLEEEIFNKQLLGSVVEETDYEFKILNLFNFVSVSGYEVVGDLSVYT